VRIGKALEKRWAALHTGGTDSTPALRPVDLRFDRFIKRVGVTFHPDESGRERSLEELSDGQRSLFHLAMTAATLDVEARLAREPKGFDVDALMLPTLTLLAIEEPENNLAPFYLSRIIRQIQDLTSTARAQAIVSSHSTSILGRVEPFQVRHFRLDDEARTAIVHELELPDDTEEASKFIREAVRAYPELYFARFVILGEGSSEEVVLPRLAEAMDLALDRSFVAVVPLGGRHVNHLWQLLRNLEIPFATLLDLDEGRSGGGWGRIKVVFDQLVANGTDPDDVLPDGWEDGFSMGELDASNEQDELAKWVSKLREHDVYFCEPLDLDMSMLLAYPKAYRALGTGMTGPGRSGSAVKAVLGKQGDADMYDDDRKNDFEWYRYLFLGRGKPTTHLRVLAHLPDEQLARHAPEELRALLEHVATTLGLADDEIT
jgi:putative ATP-dependent endonuclease of the OLD family